MTLKEHLNISARSVKLIYSLNKKFFVSSILKSFITAGTRNSEVKESILPFICSEMRMNFLPTRQSPLAYLLRLLSLRLHFGGSAQPCSKHT